MSHIFHKAILNEALRHPYLCQDEDIAQLRFINIWFECQSFSVRADLGLKFKLITFEAIFYSLSQLFIFTDHKGR